MIVVLICLAFKHVGENAVEFTWIVGVSAMTSFISCIVFCRWSYSQFAVELAQALSESQTRLETNLTSIVHPAANKNTSDHFAPAELVGRSFSLNALYQQASFELRFGRVGGGYSCPKYLFIITQVLIPKLVKSLKPLMANIEVRFNLM